MTVEHITFYDGPEAHVYAWIFFRRCYVHLEVRKWSRSTFKYLLSQWPAVVRVLKTVGVRKIYTYPETPSDPKFAKFVGRFGFSRFGPVKGFIIYEYHGG